MNHQERQNIIALGEREKLDPPERATEPEPEMVKCDECHKDMEYHDYYINGGLCWKCIERIGK